jgi:hypothetical protein
LALARQAPSGRIALARLAPLIGGVELEAARDAACVPLDAATVKGVAKAFDDFDPRPIAIRAAAQTHRAVADGTPVAVRIRRPGLERAIRNDLALLDTLALPLGAALPKADAAGLLRSVREQVLDELDFEHEASMHRRVARLLRGIDGLVVPAVRSELCSEDVFVSELLEGRTLADGALPEDGARVLVAAHVVAAGAGIALLDTRPGHVVVLDDGRIGLLGIGVARPVDRDRIDVLLDVARSALGPLDEITLDAAALGNALRRSLPALAEIDLRPDDAHLARAGGQLLATLAGRSKFLTLQTLERAWSTSSASRSSRS